MAVVERCWTPVLVLVLVTLVGGAGPLAIRLRVIPTYTAVTTSAPDSALFSSTSEAPTSSPVATSTATSFTRTSEAPTYSPVATSTATSFTRTSGAPTSSPVATSTASSFTRTSGAPTSSPVATSTATSFTRTSGAPTSSPVATSTASPGGSCPDPHAEKVWNGDCVCSDGYKKTSDPELWINNTCRSLNGGYLGALCTDVSQCNYEIHHAACDKSCQCMKPYVGFNGQTTCFDNAMGWGVAIKTAGITVLVLVVGFFIAFGIKGCSRSIRHRLSRRVPWLRRTSDISFNSGDFFFGGLSQAILDRPPSYAEEDTDKPPSYEDIFPEQEGVVNAGFSPDSATESPEQRQQRPATAGEEAPSSTAPSLPGVSVVSRSVVRGHRRGLSGPAAIHLGTTERSDQSGATEQASRTATPEQASRTATPEQASTATPEQASRTATPEQAATATPEQASTATPEQASVVTPEQASTATPEQAITATPEQASTATPEQATTATPEQASAVTPEQATTASPEQASAVTTKQNRTVPSIQKNGASSGNADQMGGTSGVRDPGQAAGTSGGSTEKSDQASGASGSSTEKSGQTAGAGGGSTDKSDQAAGASGSSTEKSGQTAGASGVNTNKSGQAAGISGGSTEDIGQAPGTSGVSLTAKVKVNVAVGSPGRPPELVVVGESRQSTAANENGQNSHSALSRPGEGVMTAGRRDPAGRGGSEPRAEPAEVWEDIKL